MKKQVLNKWCVTFFQNGKRTYSTVQTAKTSNVAFFMAEQQLYNLFPLAKYDYCDVQMAV